MVHGHHIKRTCDRPLSTHDASGNLDEEAVRTRVSLGTPSDDFAIGTRLETSADAPYLDCAYKLQEYAGRARRKRSIVKATWLARKQVYRRIGRDGRFMGDVLTLEDAPQAGRAIAAAGHAEGSTPRYLARLTGDTPVCSCRTLMLAGAFTAAAG